MEILKIGQRLIVNADDFGHSKEINMAIAEAFKNGWITTASIMPNMSGFEEACSIYYELNLCERLGVHLNLTEGRPLTESIRRMKNFCDLDGFFSFKLPMNTIFLSDEIRHVIRVELDAQILACLKKGIYPTHINSHHHVHTIWPIGTEIIALAKKYGIPGIRPSRNIGNGIVLYKQLYKFIYNSRLCFHRVRRTKFFGSAKDVLSNKRQIRDSTEVMVHPRLGPNSEVKDYDLCGDNLVDIIGKLRFHES